MRLSKTIFSSVIALVFVAGCGGSDSPGVGSNGGSGNNQKTGASDTGSSGGSKSTGGGSSGGGSGGTGGTGGDTGGTGGGSGGGTLVKRVFVTSVEYTGNLGGASGADAKCQLAADAQSLGGTYKAWVSTSSVRAIDRITGTGPWYLVDGITKVFNNKANLQTIPLSGIIETESGNYPTWTGYASPWTGSDDAGQSSGYTCSDWSDDLTSDYATTGSANADQSWGGNAGPIACNSASPLICFEE